MGAVGVGAEVGAVAPVGEGDPRVMAVDFLEEGELRVGVGPAATGNSRVN